MKSSRCLTVNWKSTNGAAHSKRKLVLRPNHSGVFTCPVKLCLHADFKSSRGLRKHIDSKHPWYYYFDSQPEVKREEMQPVDPLPKRKSSTAKKAAFSIDDGIGKEFVEWLETSCGGGKSSKEANQIGKRVMKFFMEALGSNDNDVDLTYEFVDCCLSSASIIITFLKTLECDWKLSSSGSLNYVKAIIDMVDFRKASRVSDATLRCFTVCEVYLRRAKENLRKKKNLECNRNLDLETLIAKDSWATIEEMEKVVPFHMKEFKAIIERCKVSKEDVGLTKSNLVFCVRFITTLLFLRVKCSRPMTYQYLTVTMVEKAKQNDGFIDQTEFKTSTKYLFDTLIITEDVMEILDMYVKHIRPQLNPTCDYFLVSTNGTQFQSLTTSMTMLVHQAIGKYINPTRYRQIVETESSDRLSIEEQRYVSEDQKHSSTVAKIYYKKKHSRRVAIEGKKCMDKMTAKARTGSNKSLMSIFQHAESTKSSSTPACSSAVASSPSPPSSSSSSSTITSKLSASLSQSLSKSHSSASLSSSTSSKKGECQPEKRRAVVESMEEDTLIDEEMVITDTIPGDRTLSVQDQIPNDDVVIKKEAARATTVSKRPPKNVKFTAEEDEHLMSGIRKYGRKAWSKILIDNDLTFHPSRTRDSLRARADSSAFKKLLK